MMTKVIFDNLYHYFQTENLPGKPFQELMAPSSRNPKLVKHSSPARASAVLIVLYRNDNVWHLPLIKRNSYIGSHSAQVSFPGGKKERIDKDLLDTALRETYEEIGVQIDKSQVVGQMTPLHIPISNFMVYPYVAVHDGLPSYCIDTHEVNRLIEMPLSVILNEKYVKQKEIDSQGHTINTPIYQLEDDYVWGATGMILSELAAIFKQLELF